MTEVLYSIEGRIARIVLNRPERANAMNPQMMQAILDRARQAVEEGATVVIVSGAGKGFSAGHDIDPSGAVASSIGSGSPIADRERLAAITRRWLDLWDLPIAVIAQVHGYCMAGAVEFTMFCDLVLASEDCRFGLPAIRGAGGSPPSIAYPFHLGIRHTMEYLWVQDPVDGKRAQEWGLVNKAVPLEDLSGEVDRWAERIAALPAENIRLPKAALHRALDIVGFRPAVQTGSEFDALAHTGPATMAWSLAVEELGLREAIRRRDAPYEE